jgi:hypothetical protein
MPGSSSWDVIFGTDSDRVVLSVDFPAARRGEAGFSDLASRVGPGYRFMQTRPPVTRSCQRVRGSSYIGPWVEDIRQDRYRVAAVLGYRVGSVYAAAIAEGIAQWQPMPKVILFDPRFASNSDLGLEFHREICSISSLLSDDEIERTKKMVAEISESATCDIANAAAEMAGMYWEVSTLAYERAGLGSTCNDKFIAPFDSYISWLSVAGQIDPGPVWRRSTAIVSADYAGLPDGEYPDAGDGDLIGQRVPFDVADADLLRSDRVARTVLDLLACG